MMSAPNQPLKWADRETLDAVRPEVRKLLEATPSYKKLNPEEQRELAANMVQVAAYMANPDGLVSKELSADQGVLAHAQGPLEKPDVAGKDFEAGAVKQGVKQFGELVKKVDFPKFVSGLIKGVFQAIVDSSIQQMRAYGELVANVAKSVGDYANDNITMNNARDWIAQKYPETIGIGTPAATGTFAEGETPAPAPKLEAKGENPDVGLKQISVDLSLAQPVTDLSDEVQEARLVQAARLSMAKSRQQLLASMVILGINRIVVTDGLIHAKVLFEMSAKDVLSRGYKASSFDSDEVRTKTGVSASYGGWFSPVDASMSSEVATESVTTVSSAVDESSESKAEVKARLSGEVRVNFKSDYFPMEKMASPAMIAAIQGNAKPLDTYAPPAAKT
jgi:hypothetical protein